MNISIMTDSSDSSSLHGDIDDRELSEASDSGDSEDNVLNSSTFVRDADINPQTEVPKDIKLNSSIININCHPKRNLIAAGTIDGPVYLHKFDSDNGNKELIAYGYHKKYCRAVKFSLSGEYLFTGSQDTVIYVIDLESNSEYRRFSRTGGSALYSLLPIDNYLLASGEDEGQVVIWDFRMASPVACFEECADYISSLAINKDKRTLLATSGEGVLAAYNVKSRKLEQQSAVFDDDFLCVGIIKDDLKVVVGAGDGSLNIFDWGHYENFSHRFPGHPGPVDCMQVLSDDIVCTGCEDGKIRAVQIFPSRFLGVLGHHNGFSVESLSVSYDSSLLASSSHDHTIKFWDLTAIAGEKNQDVKYTKKKHYQLNKPVNNFFSDLA